MLPSAHADWRAEAEYDKLSAELGAGLPTGSGVVGLMSEVDVDPGAGLSYLPQATTVTPFAGSGLFAGKTIFADHGAGGASGHAVSTAATFCTSTYSVSPGLTELHMLDAESFFNELYTTDAPLTYAGRVHNHSWVADTSGDTTGDERILRKLDMIADRDGVVSSIPLMNYSTSAFPVFLANAYNSITVGLRSGEHACGGSNTDGAGRMKPDLVVDEVYTSLAGPAVASSAALLLDAADPAHPLAVDPRVIKAILCTAASKDALPAWHRASTATPYDAVYGAGVLNVRRAYWILNAGRQTYSTNVERQHRGWDANTTASTNSSRRYFFSIPPGSNGRTFAATLTWHRSITRNIFGVFSSTLRNLELRLFAANSFTPDAQPIDESISSVDNVEHLFQRHLPAGQYMLEVKGSASGTPYALAWETDLGSGPVASVQRDHATGVVTLDCTELDPYATYQVESSTTLIGAWTPEATIRTADTAASFTHTWQDPTIPTGPKFYRLRWTPLR
jgi:hypothetical protein